MSKGHDDHGPEELLPEPSRGPMMAQQHFEPRDGNDLTTTIVYTVAEAAGVEPNELRGEPLYRSVDAAALESTLFANGHAASARTGTGEVHFVYLDYVVTVRDDGWVQVYERLETTELEEAAESNRPDAIDGPTEPDEPST